MDSTITRKTGFNTKQYTYHINYSKVVLLYIDSKQKIMLLTKTEKTLK